MLSFMRRQRSNLKWVLVALIVVIAGSMVIGFIPTLGDYGSAVTTSDVATVGSETVSAVEFQTTYANYVKNMQQQLTPEIRKAFGFRADS